MKKSLQLNCATKGANAAKSVPALEDGIMMFMPSGLHTITPSQNGRPVTVTVEVDAKAAGALEKQRRVMEASGLKPYFGIGEDSHASDMAAFWPKRFFWDKRIDATGSLAEGVWVEGEWSKSGREAVAGRDVRTFSPTFFVDEIRNDPDDPVHIVCCEDAKANMGALLNDPAFQSMSPLWAHDASISGSRGPGHAGATGNNQRKAMQPTKAELQARNQKLELTINGLKSKAEAITADERVALATAKGELEANSLRIENLETKEKLEAREAAEKTRVELNAENAVQRMIRGEASITLKPLDTDEIDKWRKRFQSNPEMIDEVAPLSAQRQQQPGNGQQVDASRNGNGALAPKIVSLAAARYGGFDPYATIGLAHGSGWDCQKAFAGYYEMLARNVAVKVTGGDSDWRAANFRKKGNMALDAANYFNEHLRPNEARWRNIPTVELGKIAGVYGKELQGADYSDPNNNLGVFTGTLVLQRCLPDFAYDYPELRAFYTDFADTPGLFNQTETARKVIQPAVQKWPGTLGGDGRPTGWSTVSTAKTTDISMTLTDYIAVPINFGNDLLASTARRLFDEQGHLAVKAIAGYFTQMVTDLFTAARFNAYAVQTPAGTNPNVVPVAYPTYTAGIGNFNMASLDDLQAAFDSNKVPQEDRGILLNPLYYNKLRQDPRINQYFQTALAAGANPDFVSKGKLMEMVGFMPYKAPYLPTGSPVAAPTTNNIFGFAFQKAGVILKARLPNDFTSQLGAPIPGSVTTVTDPDTGISLMLVQYVNLTQNYAEWRPEVMLGVAGGDVRAGLVCTSA